MGPLKPRFMAWAALALALQPITLPRAAGPGRIAARCAQACRQFQAACDERTAGVCMSTFPSDDGKYLECLVLGKTRCEEMAQECQMICVSGKDAAKPEL